MTDHNDLLSPEEREKRLAALESLQELSEAYTQAMDDEERAQEEYWNSLTKDQQLSVFCAVSRRIVDGELKDRGSYRYVLYDVFGFDYDSYALALHAGYMSIHNAIYDGERLEENIKQFCKINNIEVSDEQISKFVDRQHF